MCDSGRCRPERATHSPIRLPRLHGTGLLATEAPTPGAIPEAAGPVLLGPGRAGTTVASASEPTSGLSAADSSLGVAGCVDSAGTPGGTALSTGAWSILGGAIRGTTLRADLVPRPPDGSDWWLRAKIEGLVVEGKPVTLQPGAEIPVGNWGTLTPKPSPAPCLQAPRCAGGAPPCSWSSPAAMPAFPPARHS